MTPAAEWTSYVSTLLSIEAKMRNCISRFTRNPSDTDDLLQDTYIRLLSIDAARLHRIRNVSGFALIAARRVAMDWLKHKRVLQIEHFDESNDLSPPGGCPSCGIEDAVNCSQEIEQLIADMQTLSPRCAQVFTLRKVFGFTQKEVGLLLNVAVHTVEHHTFKAMRRLRASLHSIG